MKADAINVPDPALRDFVNDNPMGIELRGYEVAELLEGGRWKQFKAYRPNALGLQQVIGDAKWLTQRSIDRGVVVTYAIRPIVSLNPPKAEPAPAGDVDNVWLTTTLDDVTVVPVATWSAESPPAPEEHY